MERRKARRISRHRGGATGGGWMDTDSSNHGTPTPHRNQTDLDVNPSRIGRADREDAGFVECNPGRSIGRRGGRGGRGDRRYAEMLVERAAWIPAGDRTLVEAVHGEGLSVVAFVRRCLDRGVEPVAGSAFAGPKEDGSAVRTGDRDLDAWSRIARRRLRRLETRLASDRFAFVIARRNSWATTRRRVAVTCVLHGRSLRQASRELGISLHTVRRHVEAVEAMVVAFREAGAEARSAVEAALAEGERL